MNSNHRTAIGELAQSCEETGFPVRALSRYPISCLESMATESDTTYRGVCSVGCIGCCASAVRPHEARGKVYILTPRLLDGILGFFEEFIRDGVHLLSLGRLTLSSGSNELDNPHCIELRQQLSSFLERNYSLRLGMLSSDIACHVSVTDAFMKHLRRAMENPMLWDNICLSIDEQIPFRNAGEYDRYLEQLSRIWVTLEPALKNELDHAKAHRRRGPRILINMLVPNKSERYNSCVNRLYPDGPYRATTHRELIHRYIEPYVGNLVETCDQVPRDHVFTTAIGRLSNVPGSLVYISASWFARLGRAAAFIQCGKETGDFVSDTCFIRTKLYPAGTSQFVIRGCMATSAVSEDELPSAQCELPSWFETLKEFVLNVDGGVLGHPLTCNRHNHRDYDDNRF